MSKIRVLSDHIANQIAAGEVVERPASVAKELVENAIDAGARRVEVDVEAGGRRLLRVSDDGEGMTRDDAVLAFERHATSKISRTEDLDRIATLGFRGEALASIASIARVELVTQTDADPEATRVLIEGGRMRDVSPAARPRGTTIAVRDLFFNVPARRKFLRSEATESFHLSNLVTHYALAHPEIAFVLTNNGRETLRAAPAANLRERAYQIFGAEFLEHLLDVDGGHERVARVRGYVSAPRERRTTRDAQYLFVNGRFVRDRLVARALSEGYRSVLPHGVYPAALLFLEVPLEEVDVNVHPAKTEVRFRRAAAVADAVREAVRAALASAGFLRRTDEFDENAKLQAHAEGETTREPQPLQEAIEFGWTPAPDAAPLPDASDAPSHQPAAHFQTAPPSDAEDHATPTHPLQDTAGNALTRHARAASPTDFDAPHTSSFNDTAASPTRPDQTANVNAPRTRDSISAPDTSAPQTSHAPEMRAAETDTPDARAAETLDAETHAAGMRAARTLPPLNSAAGLVREVAVESLSANIRPLGQLEESFIIATDPEGLLLIDQHVAHERILFDKYRALEGARRAESQQLLVPETFDLTPAQAAAFDDLAPELERHGFELTRLSGRTVAIRCVPADLSATDARNVLAEILETVDTEKRGGVRENLRDEVAASLACRAAIKINMPLTQEKMRWLIDRLLLTSSPTTCPHGRPVILRLTKRDIERGFHRP
ncbi:MAG TPA: DNA mismatch repair endonuclease MutL [Pyrinomonadaceae bacterium]|nr:DNA mismatch repair endonuclease MutL [Pyrinomonadaceae bacterium]